VLKKKGLGRGCHARVLCVYTRPKRIATRTASCCSDGALQSHTITPLALTILTALGEESAGLPRHAQPQYARFCLCTLSGLADGHVMAVLTRDLWAPRACLRACTPATVVLHSPFWSGNRAEGRFKPTQPCTGAGASMPLCLPAPVKCLCVCLHGGGAAGHSSAAVAVKG